MCTLVECHGWLVSGQTLCPFYGYASILQHQNQGKHAVNLFRTSSITWQRCAKLKPVGPEYFCLWLSPVHLIAMVLSIWLDHDNIKTTSGGVDCFPELWNFWLPQLANLVNWHEILVMGYIVNTNTFQMIGDSRICCRNWPWNDHENSDPS